LRQSPPVIDAVRRNLQRAYLAHLKSELSEKAEPEAPATPLPRRGRLSRPAGGTKDTDFRAVARSCLHNLESQLANLLRVSRTGEPRIEDAMTRVHLEDCRREVKLILNPKE
jgi:hypothetical protein